jgi:hypothetical protein
VPLFWRPQSSAIFGNREYEQLGHSVAMSSNAKTMVIGATGYNEQLGYVEVYHTEDDGGSWIRLGPTIYGDATDDFFGESVDITADGTTIICGSPGAEYVLDRPGYVRIFKLVSYGDYDWEQIGQVITGETDGDLFGNSVSISDDGKKIVIGAPKFDGVNGNDSGMARIYQLDDDGMSWEKIGDDINGDMAFDEFGHSVSLSANGTIVAIGAPLAGVNNEIRTGQVNVYRIDIAGSSWEQLGERIYGYSDGDLFGLSVGASSNGNTIVIGSPQSDTGRGYARVYSLEGSDNIGIGNWVQIGQNITGDAIGDQCGFSVSLSNDGKTIAIGANYANGVHGDASGRVRIHQIHDSETGWMQLGEDIDGDKSEHYSGYSVSLSGDGNTVAIGSPYYAGDDNGPRLSTGQVKVFQSPHIIPQRP